jgi:HrpA-like RNA helicase
MYRHGETDIRYRSLPQPHSVSAATTTQPHDPRHGSSRSLDDSPQDENKDSGNVVLQGDFTKVVAKKNIMMCAFFPQGLCKYGDACEYRHGEDDPRFAAGMSLPIHKDTNTNLNTTPAKKNIMMCVFFSQGLCKYGNTCEYRHGEDDPRFEARMSAPTTPVTTQMTATVGQSVAQIKSGDTTQSLRKVELCRYFMEGSNCAAGSKCWYAHGDADLAYVYVNKHERVFVSCLELTQGCMKALKWHQASRTRQPTLSAEQPELKWCAQDVQGVGGCRLGTSCHFAHVDKKLLALSQSDRWLCPTCSFVNAADNVDVCGHCALMRPDSLFECDECGVQRVNRDNLCMVCAKTPQAQRLDHCDDATTHHAGVCDVAQDSDSCSDSSDSDSDTIALSGSSVCADASPASFRSDTDSFTIMQPGFRDIMCAAARGSQSHPSNDRLSVRAGKNRDTSPGRMRLTCDDDIHVTQTQPTSFSKAAKDLQLPSIPSRVDRFKTPLPICAAKQHIVARLLQHRVIICKSGAGSGKTTQLPRIFAEDAASFPKAIVCTQPTQIAAAALSEFMDQQHNTGSSCPEVKRVFVPTSSRSGDDVANTITTDTPSMTRLKFLAEEQFIRMCCTSCVYMNDVSVLVVDEAQERTVSTDIVLSIAEFLLHKHPDLHVVIAVSDNTDESKFMCHFDIDRSHVVVMHSKTHPVRVEHLPLSVPAKTLPSHQDIIEVVLSKLPATEKHTLVFLPAQQDVELCTRRFMSHPRRSPLWIALALFASSPQEELRKALDFEHRALNRGKRMVVFCDSTAEVLITVPGVHLVIDTGLTYCKNYDSSSKLSVHEMVQISQASADQRKHRAGNSESGLCVRLYDYKHCPVVVAPEICRSSLDLLCLCLCSLQEHYADKYGFSFLDMPHQDAIQDSIKQLVRLGCVDDQTQTQTNFDGANLRDCKITDKGRLLLELPFEPRWAGFVYNVSQFDENACMQAICVAALLNATGSLFLSASTTEEKKYRKELIGDMCKERLGDVDFHTRVFLAWQSQAKVPVDSDICSVCLTACGAHTRAACVCQRKFAAERLLNMAVIEHIQSVVSRACKTSIVQYGARGVDHNVAQAYDVTTGELIARCLMQSFPERVFWVPLPTQIQQGIVSPRGEITHLSDGTVFMCTIQASPVRAVFVNKLVKIKDRILAEGLEPVRPEQWAQQQPFQGLSLTSQMQSLNIHNDFARSVHTEHLGPMYQSVRYLPELRGKCISGSVPDSLNVIEFYARKADAKMVRDCVQAAKKHIEAHSPVVSLDILDGAVKVTLKPGLEVEDVNFTSDACKVFVRVTPQEDGRLPPIDQTLTDMRINTDLLAEPSRYVGGKLQVTFKSAQHAAPFMKNRGNDIDSQLTEGMYRPTIAISCQYTTPQTIDQLEKHNLEVKRSSKPTKCIVYQNPNSFIRQCATEMEAKGGLVKYEKNRVSVQFPASFDLSFYVRNGWSLSRTAKPGGRLTIKGVHPERRIDVVKIVRSVRDAQVETVSCKLSASPYVTESLWKRALQHIKETDPDLSVTDMPQQPGGDRYVHTHTHTCMHAHIHAYIHTHSYIHTYRGIYIHTSYIHTHTHTHIHHTHLHTYIHTLTHTHRHMQMGENRM